MELEYKINFIVDGEAFDPATIEASYGWFKSKGKDRERAIRNLVEKVRAEHPSCNVLVLGDFIERPKTWYVIGYAARTKESPSSSGDSGRTDDELLTAS